MCGTQEASCASKERLPMGNVHNNQAVRWAERVDRLACLACSEMRLHNTIWRDTKRKGSASGSASVWVCAVENRVSYAKNEERPTVGGAPPTTEH